MRTARDHDIAALNQTLKAAADLLAGANRVWMGTHVDPDGDAIGSTLGLARILSSRGVEVTAACQDPAPPEVAFLPGLSHLVAEKPAEGSLIVTLDAADLSRVGSLLSPGVTPDLVIDHHVSNPGFGAINLIDPSAASTAEIVLMLADTMSYDLDTDTATCLLTGLVTDTNAFRTTNTTAATLRAAERLVAVGADLPGIAAMAFRRPLGTMRLAALAVNRLEMHGPFAVTCITRADLDELRVPASALRGITMMLADAAEPAALAVLRERGDGSIDVSMRSKRGVDLIPAARSLGGGGHPQASGARLELSMTDAAARVRSALEDHVTLDDYDAYDVPSG